MSHAFIDNSGDYFLELDNEVVVKANVVAELERERIYGLIHRYACDDFSVELDKSLEESLNAIANGALAAGHDYGSQDERNRIIKLLENELPQFTEKNPGQPVEVEAWGLRWAIALIKGEQK